MTTYNEIAKSLLNENAKEFYRFQGHNSFECYDIRNNRFNNEKNHYVYFSKSIDHHYYFTIKRIRQLINTIVLNDTHYKISRKQLKDPVSFNNIKSLVFNSEKVRNLNSISLVCDQKYYALLRENCINNMEKTKESGIERVDRRVFGGGYGITGTWLYLLDDLTYFSSSIRISVIDILKMLDIMHSSDMQTSPNLIKNILEQKSRTYKISANLFNDFHKYNIMNDLERIYDENLLLSTSQFGTNPSQTMKNVLITYQKNRDKVLILIDKKYKKL